MQARQPDRLHPVLDVVSTHPARRVKIAVLEPLQVRLHHTLHNAKPPSPSKEDRVRLLRSRRTSRACQHIPSPNTHHTHHTPRIDVAASCLCSGSGVQLVRPARKGCRWMPTNTGDFDVPWGASSPCILHRRSPTHSAESRREDERGHARGTVANAKKRAGARETGRPINMAINGSTPTTRHGRPAPVAMLAHPETRHKVASAFSSPGPGDPELRQRPH